MKTSLLQWGAGIACAASLFAGQTHIWSQGEFSDFEKGNIKNLSLRSDGLLTLAPRSRELYDTSSAYLWALAQDSKGNLYAGGGTGAKLYRIGSDGKGKMLADLDALEIHAIAIDSKDRVYAATSPDGKIYRVTGNSKPEVFFDPKAKYIWALAFDSQGDLFVATGDQGEIYRVTPDGKGRVFFKTDETHVRSMTLDPNGNLVVGTDPGGLVLRVSPAGEGFVLYQMPKKEVTAVAVGPDGSIYAAGVGNKQAGATPPPSPLPSAPQATVQVNAPGSPGPPPVRQTTPAPSLGAAGVSGGSEVWRIERDGNPRRVWSNSQDVVYTVVFDSSSRLLVGVGNKGNIYRIESPTSYTALLSVPATQVTALQQGRDGHLYVASGNVGKVYEIGPETEHEGTIESDVFDSSMYSLWGRLSYEGHLNGGQVAIVTRSGNLDQPQKNWSPWSAAILSAKGARITSPAARFVQWKATLTADGGGRSPELESVDLAYLPKNVEPHIDQIEITPPNYKFPASSTPLLSLLQPQQTLNLPPLGKHGGAPTSFSLDTSTSTPAMQLSKGFIGVRWAAADPNGDAMIYTVEIRGTDEKEWKPLKDKVVEKYFSWDSTAFPDGEYKLRITASDAPGNPPAEALSVKMESDPFLIDNTPPRISNLAAVRNGARLQVRWHAADALNNIDRAEYSLDGGEWTVAEPVSKLSDSLELDYELTLDAAPGEHTIAVRVADDYDNLAADKIVIR
jgi:WD40 repeat protein